MVTITTHGANNLEDKGLPHMLLGTDLDMHYLDALGMMRVYGTGVTGKMGTGTIKASTRIKVLRIM